MADNANIQNDENWSAAGVVGMFDSALLSRARRKHRMLLFCWCLIVAVVLGIPLLLTWQKLEDSRRLTLIEEFASRRSELQDLPNDKNPAVAAQLEKADQLRQQATTGSVGESVTTLREALNRLRDAAAIDQKLEQIRPLLNPLGETLSPAATPEDGSPWLLSSAVIDQRLVELQKRHAQIVTHLDMGESAKAEQMLAELLRDVGQLQRDNVSAMRTETARRNWLRLQAKIPERLEAHAALPAIGRAGKDADAGWDSGDWSNAKLLYSGAAEDLEQFLYSESTPTEKAELLQTDADAVVRLETEKADLMQQINVLRDEKIKLGEQLSATNEQRLTAENKVAALTKEGDRLRTAETAATEELGMLQPLKNQFATAAKSLQEAQDSVTQLTQAKSAAEESLRRTETQLAAKDAEINALRSATSNGDGNSVIVQVSASLAAIDSRLAAGVAGKDASTAVELAREHLADALSEYDKSVQLKQQAIAEKYLPTSTRVKGIDATIAQAEATLRSGLNVLDEPLANQFDELQTVIDAAESSHRTLLKEVAPEHKDAVALKQRIMGLKDQQTRLAAAKDRHAGTTTPAATNIVAICRTEVQNLLTQRQAAEFARLEGVGKVPAATKSITNSLGMKLALIPAGTFMMGSPPTEADRYTDEIQHRVTLTQDFYLGTTEVTRSQWESVMGTTPWKGQEYANEGPNFAATYVNWNDAVEFCKRLSSQEGKAYRLPTEAEWEYACRGGTTSAYVFGDNVGNLSDYAWWGGGIVGDGNAKSEQYAHEVGLKRANAFGLYDMHGNVYEWCSDWKGDYPSGNVIDPLGPSEGPYRFSRGGSWFNFAGLCRSALRNWFTPDNRLYNLGFRVAVGR